MPERLDYEPKQEGKELHFTGAVRIVAFAIGGGVLGGVASFLLWLIVGGWGAPAILILVGLGLIVGITASFAAPARRRPA